MSRDYLPRIIYVDYCTAAYGQDSCVLIAQPLTPYCLLLKSKYILYNTVCCLLCTTAPSVANGRHHPEVQDPGE